MWEQYTEASPDGEIAAAVRPAAGRFGPAVNTISLAGEADARTRTGDPFITSEVLYQLSYVGGAGRV